MAAQEIKVPDIGDFEAVEVIEVLVAEGDEIAKEQPLITLESDKATLEVPASAAGTITRLQVGEGDKVSEGDVIAVVEAGDDKASEGGAKAKAADDAGARADRAQAKEDAGRQPAAAETGGSGGGTLEVKVPDIGDFEAVEVIEVLVAEGDDVAQEQPLITLESDKATLEVPSSAAGTITRLQVGEGDKVSEGDVIAQLETAGQDQPKPPAGAKTEPAESRAEESVPGAGRSPERGPTDPGRSRADRSSAAPSADDGGRLAAVDEGRFSKAHASPSVRKYARQLGVDLGRVEGSGRKGRILQEDVQAFVKKALAAGGREAAPAAGGGVPAQPDIDYSQFGEVETVELARIRKISARAVHNNWLLIPHVTQFDSADITEMEAFRQANKDQAARQGVRLTPLAFLLKASAAALAAFPDMNSSLTADGEHLVHKKYYHIAVAVDTENGLMMPVIRDVDQKGVYALARELDDISSRARDGKLKSSEMRGASFSISSLGGVGGIAFTPIVNSPEVAILGVSRHSWQPVWRNGEFVARLILPLSLSYDHRVIDGAKAARITSFFSQALGDLRTLLL